MKIFYLAMNSIRKTTDQINTFKTANVKNTTHKFDTDTTKSDKNEDSTHPAITNHTKLILKQHTSITEAE
jgi:hypothetical protein